MYLPMCWSPECASIQFIYGHIVYIIYQYSARFALNLYAWENCDIDYAILLDHYHLPLFP